MANVFIGLSDNVAYEVHKLQLNATLQSILSNFASNAAPTNHNLIINKVNTIPPVGMLYFSTSTNALYRKTNTESGLYSSPSGAYGNQNFSRRGISYRVESNLTQANTNVNAYEVGEFFYSLYEDTHYFKDINNVFINMGKGSYEANDYATYNNLTINIYATYSNAVIAAYANDYITYQRIMKDSSHEFVSDKTFQQNVIVEGNVAIGAPYAQERLVVFGNVLIGGSSSNNFIAFRGTKFDDQFGGYKHNYIGERIYEGLEASELLLFKGNDPLEEDGGPDRIRLLSGDIRFDTYSGGLVSGTFEEVGSNSLAIPRWLIRSNGKTHANTVINITDSVYNERTNLSYSISQGLTIKTLGQDNLVLGTDNTPVIYVTPTGNVGIKVNNPTAGLEVDNNIITDGVDVLSNDYITLNAAKSNDYSTYIAAVNNARANDWLTLNNTKSNDYLTYVNALSTNFANDYLTYTTLQGNVYSTYVIITGNLYSTYRNITINTYATYSNVVNIAYANDYSTLQAAYANDYLTALAQLAEAYANDWATLNAARGNDWSTLNIARSNDWATLNAALGNDWSTLNTARANDWATLNVALGNDWSTLNTARANDWSTLQAAYANDYITMLAQLTEAYSNDYLTLRTAYSNDWITLTTTRANDWSTYVAAVNDARANDYSTLLSARANDYLTLRTTQANDYATLQAAYANDHTTRFNLLSDAYANDLITYRLLQSNDWTTYTLLQSNDYLTYTKSMSNDWLTLDWITNHQNSRFYVDKYFEQDVSISGNLAIGASNISSPDNFFTVPERLWVYGNVRIGGDSLNNFIVFRGTTGDDQTLYTHTYIGERVYTRDTLEEKSELVLFKGNDPNQDNVGPDRIRLLAPEVRIDTYQGYLSGQFETVANTSTATTIMRAFKSNVDINGVLNITDNILVNSTDISYNSSIGLSIGTINTVPIVFNTGDLEKARIHTSGMSIGTSLVPSRLTLYEGINPTTSAPTYRGTLILSGVGGTIPFTNSPLDFVGGIEFITSTSNNGYGWRVVSAEEPYIDTPLIFQSRESSSSWSDRITFTANGRLGVGTRYPSANGEIIGTLKVSDSISINGINLLGNDWSTLNIARSNDWSTLNAARSNDWSTLNAALGNDWSTLNIARSNDWSTLNAALGNDWSTLNTARANDWSTLNAALGNDWSTLNAARSNDYTTYQSVYSYMTGLPQNSKSANYTLEIADAGKHIFHPSADTTARTFTIPPNSNTPYSIGTAVTFINHSGAGTVSISIDTDIMRLAGSGATGTRTLASNGVATAIKVTSTEWIISGTGLT